MKEDGAGYKFSRRKFLGKQQLSHLSIEEANAAKGKTKH